jgi:hypothetical protein
LLLIQPKGEYVMGREIQRVPLDFGWPLHKEWGGWLSPPWDNSLSDERNEEIDEEWYENGRYDPPKGRGWQIWETVSEGSPISPVFATSEKLVAWIVSEGYSEKAARAFVGAGHVPSMMIANGRIYMNIECAILFHEGKEGND